MKLSKIKHPKMVESSLKAKLRDEEEDSSPKSEPKMMAKGGDVEPQAIDEIKPDKGYGKIIIMKAEGGMVKEDEMASDDSSIASAIMKRRMMAKGGEVEIESNAEEMPNQLNKLNEAALKENYDSDLESVSQPDDSNDDHREMIRSIRSKMISKRISGMK